MMSRFVCLTVSLLLIGCATNIGADQSEDRADEEATGVAGCFYRRQVADFRPLARGNMIVYAPTKSHAFHVRISPPSTSLRWAESIAFRSRHSRICGYAGDRILIDNGGSAQYYSVVSVYRLDELAHESLLAQYGKGVPGAGLEPEETTGAEIERDIEPGDQNEE